jgi:hypothetical protein
LTVTPTLTPTSTPDCLFDVDIEVVTPTPTPTPTLTVTPTLTPTLDCSFGATFSEHEPVTPTPTPTPTFIPIVIDENTKINIFFDSSGSMDDTLPPLQTMRTTILKNCLLPFYNNNSSKYDSLVTITSIANERTFNWLTTTSGSTANVSKVINLVFTDENSPYNAGIENTTFNSGTRSGTYNTDIAALRNVLDSAPNSGYYRAIIFRVQGFNQFKDFLSAVFNGTNAYSGTNGLSDKTNVVSWVQDVTAASTAQYYTNQIITAINTLGYNLSPC